jgi:transcriptional regulator
MLSFMYVPPAFAVDQRDFALNLIARYPFGLLTTCDQPYPQATHLPMLARLDGDDLVIAGHVARANPHARDILSGRPATAVFLGPHAYVSAAWYETPPTNVPTWNYTAAHASGRLSSCDAGAVLAALTEKFESGRPDPWRLDRIDPAYYANQLRGIVAFEMRVERLACVAKLSQNRSAADRARVIDALSRSPHPLDRECAQAMHDAQGGQTII